MKPYVVEMTIRTVVMADDQGHAFIVARTQFRDIAREETPDVFVDDEVRSEEDLPDGWDLACLPYGGDGNTRLSEILPTAQAATDKSED
jgi:hypothetical protein